MKKEIHTNEEDFMQQRVFILKLVIVSLIVLFLPNEVSASNQDVTVKLSYFLGNQTEITVRINGTYVIKEDNRKLTSNKLYLFKIVGNAIDVYEDGQRVASYTSSFTAKPLVFSEENYITINNRKYLGDMRFTLESNFIRPINTVPLEEYLKGVVPREMSPSWGNNGGMEALKAQAVTARTFMLRRINSVVTDTESHQVYGGYHWHNNTNLAVDATSGEVVIHNGHLIDSFYSATNGGKLLSNRNVWGSAKLPYLDVKNDPYDLKSASLGNNRINWDFTIQKEQINLRDKNLNSPQQWWDDVQEANSATVNSIKNWLISRGHIDSQFDIKIVSIADVQFTTQFTANEVMTGKVTINYILRHNSGNSFVMDDDHIKIQTITINNRHDILRAMFSGARMLSSYVKEVEETNSTFTIRGGGWGHNIGMSQYGAYQMSREGLNYRDIISFYYQGAQVIGPNPIFSMQVTSKTEMYNQPNPLATRTGSIAAQKVNVFEVRGDWYLIDTWLGRMWVNPDSPITGEIETYTERLYVPENTSIYSSPTSQVASGAISPQNVTPLRKWGDWYEIKTWLGPKWIKPNALLLGGIDRISESITLTEVAEIFHSPLDNQRRSSVSVQKVTATHQWNDWYRIETWLGAMWMKPEAAIIGEVVAHPEGLYVTGNTSLYRSPTAKSSSGAIAPQNVETISKWGEWYQINTWLGPKWIKPTAPLLGGIKQVSETISLTKKTQMYNSPLDSQHQSALAVQKVTATHQWNDWYRINTWLGPQWIKL
ncbi:SpoIID/LytB domain-containing protein [Bacillaceae bacterium IKA-2]|nr:SpoIID/LytB domain-containing protein [Bacillaceae bacterium IKA-2]